MKPGNFKRDDRGAEMYVEGARLNNVSNTIQNLLWFVPCQNQTLAKTCNTEVCWTSPDHCLSLTIPIPLPTCNLQPSLK